MVSENADRLAVLIDADNAQAAIVEGLLAEVAKYGTAHVKRAYGDWTGTSLRSWKEQLLAQSIQPVQQFAYTTGKNATDAAMVIDAMDLLYSDRFDGFCLVSSDSDFTRLAARIRESGLTVYGFGERKTPKPFVAACDKFIYIENLAYDQDPATPAAATLKAAPPTPAAKLKQDTALVNLLRNAVEAASDEDGWAPLASVGHIITKQRPEFDSRNYGYAKLSELITATTLFVLTAAAPATGRPAFSTSATNAGSRPDSAEDADAVGDSALRTVRRRVPDGHRGRTGSTRDERRGSAAVEVDAVVHTGLVQEGRQFGDGQTCALQRPSVRHHEVQAPPVAADPGGRPRRRADGAQPVQWPSVSQNREPTDGEPEPWTGEPVGHPHLLPEPKPPQRVGALLPPDQHGRTLGIAPAPTTSDTPVTTPRRTVTSAVFVLHGSPRTSSVPQTARCRETSPHRESNTPALPTGSAYWLSPRRAMDVRPARMLPVRCSRPTRPRRSVPMPITSSADVPGGSAGPNRCPSGTAP